MRPYLEKKIIKKGLVEWLKVKALSSNPSTAPPPKKACKMVDAAEDDLGIFME
jgi:hypothetical protein